MVLTLSSCTRRHLRSLWLSFKPGLDLPSSRWGLLEGGLTLGHSKDSGLCPALGPRDVLWRWLSLCAQGCCTQGHGGGEPADWPGPIKALPVSASVWGCSRLFSNLANGVWPRQELLTQGKAKEQQSGWLISSISTHIPPTRFTKLILRDLPGDSVVKTPCLQCSGHGFNPWSGN